MTNPEGRVSRKEEVRTERRRRDDATIDGSQALNLAVSPEIQRKLTAQGRTWRWVNDVGTRIKQLTEDDDWDRVEGVEPREVVIDKAKGATVKTYLLSKPVEFIREDRAKRDAARRETEKAMLEGQVPNAGTAPASRPDNVYVPPGNKIERGNQII